MPRVYSAMRPGGRFEPGAAEFILPYLLRERESDEMRKRKIEMLRDKEKEREFRRAESVRKEAIEARKFAAEMRFKTARLGEDIRAGEFKRGPVHRLRTARLRQYERAAMPEKEKMWEFLTRQGLPEEQIRNILYPPKAAPRPSAFDEKVQFLAGQGMTPADITARLIPPRRPMRPPMPSAFDEKVQFLAGQGMTPADITARLIPPTKDIMAQEQKHEDAIAKDIKDEIKRNLDQARHFDNMAVKMASMLEVPEEQRKVARRNAEAHRAIVKRLEMQLRSIRTGLPPTIYEMAVANGLTPEEATNLVDEVERGEPEAVAALNDLRRTYSVP